jgi:hypothetical protein
VSWNRQSPDLEVKQQSRWGWLFYRRVKTGKTFYRPMNRVVHAHVKAMTTGVRWYLPRTTDWGSLVRCLWNAAACTQVFAFHIPWGGPMAFQAELFRDTDLLHHWKRCFCEDTVSYGVLRRLGLRLGFVPAATMVNPERSRLTTVLPSFAANCLPFGCTIPTGRWCGPWASAPA